MVGNTVQNVWKTPFQTSLPDVILVLYIYDISPKFKIVFDEMLGRGLISRQVTEDFSEWYYSYTYKMTFIKESYGEWDYDGVERLYCYDY